MRRLILLVYLLCFSLSAQEAPLVVSINDGDETRIANLLASNQFSEVEQASALQAAVSNKRIGILKSLLKAGFKVNAVKHDGFNATALMFAAYLDQIEMMEILVKEGANINQVDEIGDPAINWAAYAGHHDAVAWLLARKARIDLVGHGNAIEIAMRRGFDSIVTQLCGVAKCHQPTENAQQLIVMVDQIGAPIANGLRVEDALTKDETGRPILHRLARNGRLDLLKSVAQGLDKEQLIVLLDTRDVIGYSALMESARNGHISTVRWLLDQGANPNLVGSQRALSLTALHLAALSGHQQITELLIRNGVDINAQDSDGNTAAMWAYFSNQQSTAKLLLDLGADPKIKNKYGNSLPAPE